MDEDRGAMREAKISVDCAKMLQSSEQALHTLFSPITTEQNVINNLVELEKSPAV